MHRKLPCPLLSFDPSMVPFVVNTLTPYIHSHAALRRNPVLSSVEVRCGSIVRGDASL